MTSKIESTFLLSIYFFSMPTTWHSAWRAVPFMLFVGLLHSWPVDSVLSAPFGDRGGYLIVFSCSEYEILFILDFCLPKFFSSYYFRKLLKGEMNQCIWYIEICFPVGEGICSYRGWCGKIWHTQGGKRVISSWLGILDHLKEESVYLLFCGYYDSIFYLITYIPFESFYGLIPFSFIWLPLLGMWRWLTI